MIKFRKMNDDEFRRFADKDVKNYAQTLIKGRGFDAETALKESEKEFKNMLADGLYTKNQFLMFIEDVESKNPVGEIWYGYEEENGEKQVFLAEFLIYEEYRRQGYATSALKEMERIAKADGCTVSALYVWDHNPTARNLYKKCGYMDVSHGNGGTYMKKIISVDALINRFVKRSKEILGDNLVGIYLHGSSVMGCFNPQKSDIDLIIVVDQPLTDSVKKEYMEMVVEYNAYGPPKGIEMSIVLRKVCMPFIYPTPYELHFSAGHLDRYKDDPDDYVRRMNGTDKDLAAHFTIINHRGKCLYGAAIKDVFDTVPKSDYMDSIWYDVEGAAEEITEYPMYLTLNLARVLAYKEDGLVLSKKEGGEWALSHMPARYQPLIKDALREYTESANITYDTSAAGRYAKYVIKRIKQCNN